MRAFFLLYIYLIFIVLKLFKYVGEGGDYYVVHFAVIYVVVVVENVLVSEALNNIHCGMHFFGQKLRFCAESDERFRDVFGESFLNLDKTGVYAFVGGGERVKGVVKAVVIFMNFYNLVSDVFDKQTVVDRGFGARHNIKNGICDVF